MIATARITGRTHVGKVRKRNEDAYFIGEHLIAIADGMGGHVAGDVAAATVISAIRPFDRLVEPERLAPTLASSVHAASLAMQRRIVEEPSVAGMGTTLVAAMWHGYDLAIANIGDSRAYLLRENVMQQLTDDHVYGRLVANAANVPNLPERLARFLDGRADGRSPDLAPLTLQSGDRLLLCSDGLSSYVAQGSICAGLAIDDLDSAADDLVKEALEAGGRDNVTVILLSID